MGSRLLWVVTALVFVSACASRSTDPPPSGQLGLPVIGQPRGAAFSPASLVQLGREHTQARGVTDLGDSARYESSAADPWPLAYGVYRFDVDDYPGDSTLRMTWDEAPLNRAHYFVGVANWTEQRWDFFPGDSDIIDFGSFEHYRSSGELMCVLVFEGDNAGQLAQLRVGAPPVESPPDAVLTGSPLGGPVPVTVDFDATGSLDPDGGEIVQYDWDLDGNGSFEQIGGAATASQLYTVEGSITVSVRVTDDEDETDIATLRVDCGDWTNLMYNWDLEADYSVSAFKFYDAHPGPGGTTYLCGHWGWSPNPWDNLSALIKLDAGGNVVWSRTVNALGDHAGWHVSFSHIGVDSAGNVYAGGMLYSSADISRLLLVKVSAAGEVVWSKSAPLSSYLLNMLYSGDMAVGADGVYIGNRGSAAGHMRALILKLSLDGAVEWQAGFGPADPPETWQDYNGTNLETLAVGPGGNLYLAGSIEGQAGNSHETSMAIKVDPVSGAVITATEWSNLFVVNKLMTMAATADSVFIASSAFSPNESNSINAIVALDQNLQRKWFKSWTGQNGWNVGDLQSLAVDASDHAYMLMTDATEDSSTIVQFDPAGQILNKYWWVNTAEGFKWQYRRLIVAEGSIGLIGSCYDLWQPDFREPLGQWQVYPDGQEGSGLEDASAREFDSVPVDPTISDCSVECVEWHNVEPPGSQSSSWAIVSRLGFPIGAN